jgi:DNA-binding response OmpR family regulator
MARILLADDDPFLRRLVGAHLSTEGHQIDEVGDGEAALEAVREAVPALLLIDRMMPCRDGLAVVRAIRRDPAVQGLPILMLTAREGERDLVEAFDAGVDDFITKPFRAAELHARVSRLLSRAAL